MHSNRQLAARSKARSPPIDVSALEPAADKQARSPRSESTSQRTREVYLSRVSIRRPERGLDLYLPCPFLALRVISTIYTIYLLSPGSRSLN